jgi:hypothetical protein
LAQKTAVGGLSLLSNCVPHLIPDSKEFETLTPVLYCKVIGVSFNKRNSPMTRVRKMMNHLFTHFAESAGFQCTILNVGDVIVSRVVVKQAEQVRAFARQAVIRLRPSELTQ